MSEHHDTNLTYDSCKDCEELAKEVMRVVKQRDNLKAEILELNAINSGLRYAISELENRSERWKKTSERFKSEADKWLNKSTAKNSEIENIKKEMDELKEGLDYYKSLCKE